MTKITDEPQYSYHFSSI